MKLDQLVERIDREGGYSEGFVREMHIFQVELRDFFNATGALFQVSLPTSITFRCLCKCCPAYQDWTTQPERLPKKSPALGATCMQ